MLVYLYTRHSFKCSVCVLLFPFYQPYKVDVTICIVKIRKQRSVQFSCSVMSDSLRSHGLQHARLPCHQLSELAHFMWFSQWGHPTISSSLIPFSSLLQPLPVSGYFPVMFLQFFKSGGQSFGVSASASVLPNQCQESSPTPWFKSINSSALSFLHSPTLTSIHDHWKNHSFDYMDLCQQSNVSAF